MPVKIENENILNLEDRNEKFKVTGSSSPSLGRWSEVMISAQDDELSFLPNSVVNTTL